MDSLYPAIRFLQAGGMFMYPIALVLLIGLAIIVERWWVVTRAIRACDRERAMLLPLIRSGGFTDAWQATQQGTTPASRMVEAAIAGLQDNAGEDAIEALMEERLLDAIPILEKRTAYLATLANVATLLGLLGTIIGLIAAFTAVASADPADKAVLLSQSISVAMNTTAFGLMAAIPLLMAHTVLDTKSMALVDSLQRLGVQCLNQLIDARSLNLAGETPLARH